MIKSKFAKTCLLILIMIALVFAVRFLFLGKNTPTLQQVLSHNPLDKPFDPSLFLASILTFSFAAMSVAKGYEIFQRSKTVSVLPGEEEAPSILSLKDQEIDDLKKGMEWLEVQKEEKEEDLKKLKSKLEDLNQIEQVLRKSNIALSNECEKIRFQNEELALKKNSTKIKPKRKTKAAKKRVVKKKKVKK